MLIREMIENDLEQVAELEKHCFGASAWSLNAFRGVLSDKNALYLTATEEADGVAAVIGCCGVWQSFEDGEIMNVMVRPEYRRNGCAAMLLRELFRLGNQRGIENYTLEVREGNSAAIRLYESLGFSSAGIRKNFYDDPKENAVIMWKRKEMEL